MLEEVFEMETHNRPGLYLLVPDRRQLISSIFFFPPKLPHGRSRPRREDLRHPLLLSRGEVRLRRPGIEAFPSL